MDNNVVVGWQVQQTWTVAVVREFKRPYYWEWQRDWQLWYHGNEITQDRNVWPESCVCRSAYVDTVVGSLVALLVLPAQAGKQGRQRKAKIYWYFIARQRSKVTRAFPSRRHSLASVQSTVRNLRKKTWRQWKITRAVSHEVAGGTVCEQATAVAWEIDDDCYYGMQNGRPLGFGKLTTGRGQRAEGNVNASIIFALAFGPSGSQGRVPSWYMHLHPPNLTFLFASPSSRDPSSSTSCLTTSFCGIFSDDLRIVVCS